MDITKYYPFPYRSLGNNVLLKKLALIDLHFAEQVRIALDSILQKWPSKNDGELVIVKDAKYIVVPPRSSCPSGEINFEQLAIS